MSLLWSVIALSALCIVGGFWLGFTVGRASAWSEIGRDNFPPIPPTFPNGDA